MFRSRGSEIPDLIRRLGSRRRAVVDAARARLSIIGARAVEDLIEALEGDDSRIRARVMPLLALIQDPRGRAPLTAMLLDRSRRLREIAAHSLGRFPSAESVCALRRLLDQERDESVRSAALEALVAQYVGGREDAVSTILDRLSDEDESPRARLAALSLLRHLKPSQRRSIVRRFVDSPDDALRKEAEVLLNGNDADRSPPQLAPVIEQLASDDYAVWNRAVRHLAGLGPPAVAPLLEAMSRHAHDPEFCARAGMALKAMGPRRGRMLADALEATDAPLPLQVLVEAIGAIGEKSSIYRLKDLIERLGQDRPGQEPANGFDPYQRVRAKAHLELARVGSRVAIDDLRQALTTPERRVDLEMLGAAELIGNREEIGVLLRAYAREDDFMRERIGSVIRAIMKRERIRRNNRMFQTLTCEQRKALEAILPPPGRRPSRRRRPTTGPSAGP